MTPGSTDKLRTIDDPRAGDVVVSPYFVKPRRVESFDEKTKVVTFLVPKVDGNFEAERMKLAEWRRWMREIKGSRREAGR